MNHFVCLVGFSAGPASVICGRQKSVAAKGMELDGLGRLRE